MNTIRRYCEKDGRYYYAEFNLVIVEGHPAAYDDGIVILGAAATGECMDTSNYNALSPFMRPFNKGFTEVSEEKASGTSGDLLDLVTPKFTGAFDPSQRGA